MGALPIIPTLLRQLKEMIDRGAFDRKVMILKGCLSLARVYHDQDNFKQSEFYSRLSSEYFEEILGVVNTPECTMERSSV